MGIRNVDSMVKQLCDVCFGFHKVFSFIPHFPKLESYIVRHAIPSEIEKPNIHMM